MLIQLGQVDDYIRELEDLENKNEKLEAEKVELFEAIENLWKSHRPVAYDESEHLKHPLINIISKDEKQVIEIFIKQKYNGVKP